MLARLALFGGITIQFLGYSGISFLYPIALFLCIYLGWIRA